MSHGLLNGVDLFVHGGWWMMVVVPASFHTNFRMFQPWRHLQHPSPPSPLKVSHLRHQTTQTVQLLSHELHLQGGQPTEHSHRESAPSVSNELQLRIFEIIFEKFLPKRAMLSWHWPEIRLLHRCIFEMVLTPRAKCGQWFIVISEQIPCVFQGFPMGLSSIGRMLQMFSSLLHEAFNCSTEGLPAVEIQWRWPVADHIPPFLSTYFKLDMIFNCPFSK